MSLYKVYNRALYDHMQAHAVWWPIVDQAEVGAYGVIRGGVFQRFGNIRDRFGIDFETGAETPTAPLKFASNGVKKTHLDADGEVKTLAELAGAASARVKFEFSNENSVYLQIANVHSVSMENLDEIAQRLLKIEPWDPRFKVVWRSYVAEGGTILAAEEKGTEIEFEGAASALQAIDDGTVKAHMGFSSSSATSLQLSGQTGNVALKMFGFARKYWLFGEKRIKVLTAGTEDEDAVWSSSETWGPDLEDNI